MALLQDKNVAIVFVLFRTNKKDICRFSEIPVILRLDLNEVINTGENLTLLQRYISLRISLLIPGVPILLPQLDFGQHIFIGFISLDL